MICCVHWIHLFLNISGPGFDVRQRQTGNYMNILIAEDEIEYRNALCEALTMCGHTVAIATDGIEALDLLKRKQCDLIISDINMPHRSGTQLHEMVRSDERLRDIPSIYVTRLAVLRLTTPVDKSGLDYVLGKMSFDRLMQLVDDLSVNRGVIPNGIALA